MSTSTHTVGGAATLPRLISVEEAAELLAVSPSTVRNWIAQDTIPYLALPPTGGRRRYRIPLQGLLNTLSGNYDLAGDLERLNEAATDVTSSGVDALARLHQERPRKRRVGDQPREISDADPGSIFEHSASRTQ